MLGEDGQPRKMKEGEDPDHIGLVLEWVYGTIVSTAEKARDGAKRLLGVYYFKNVSDYLLSPSSGMSSIGTSQFIRSNNVL